MILGFNQEEGEKFFTEAGGIYTEEVGRDQ